MLRILCVIISLGIPFAFSLIITEKPDYVKTCFKKSPDFVNCSTQAVQLLFNSIPKGVPEVGLKPLDPLRIPKIKILQGGGGPVTVNASLTNVTVVGFGKTEVIHNSVDPVKYDFHTKLRLERIRIDGLYELLGRILVIPLRGKGSCWFDARNLNIYAKSDIKMIEHDGYHFYNVTAVDVKFSIGGLKLHMGNLFDGIKALEEPTNAYLNANWKPVAESLNPILSKTIEDIMIGILRQVFDHVPADFFIGDIEEK